VATGTPTSFTSGNQAVNPTCSELLPLAPTAVTTTNDQASWTGQTYTTTLASAGWIIYELPANGSPWGISFTDQVWLVDQGRQVLARLPNPAQVTACKLQDADGNPATIGDQTPVVDWPLYLRINGLRQTPGKLTGADGCAVWDGLQPGPAYGVDEDVGTGWVALTPTSHDFGLSSAGQSYSYTFINQLRRVIYLPLVYHHAGGD